MKELLSLTIAERGWIENVEDLSDEMWTALDDAGVPDVSGSLFREETIVTLNHTVPIIQRTISGFQPKT